MIRDRLVVGIRDAALSHQLQLDSDLTLDKAMLKIRQRKVATTRATKIYEGRLQFGRSLLSKTADKAEAAYIRTCRGVGRVVRGVRMNPPNSISACIN